MNTRPASARIRRGAHCFPPLWQSLLLAALAGLPATALADPANLVRNADFSSGMSNWVKPPEFGSVDPIAYDRANISQPVVGSASNYYGPVISQGLNVTAIANQTINATIKLAKFSNLPPGNSISVDLGYLLDGGARATASIIQPNNGLISFSEAPFSGSFTFPANATKLVKISVNLTGQGAFLADDLSLTGPFTAGIVPVITAVNPTSVTYGSPITLTGTDLGSAPGVLTVNGSAESVVIDSWSPTSVTCHLVNPNHGGLLGLETGGVMASQNHRLTVLSPHYVVSTSKAVITAVPGQLVELDAIVAFYNNFNTPTGISLTVPASGSASSFTPLPLKHQGGSRLRLDTTGLAPGLYNYTIASTDGTTAGSPAPLQLRIHASDHLTFTYGDRDYPASAQPLPSPLVITGHQPLTIFYKLFDPANTNITEAAPLMWSISAPGVLDFKTNPGSGTGPTLYPLANGPCTLTYSTVDGLTGTLEITVSIGGSSLPEIGFTSATMNNTGLASNRFHATTDGWSNISQIGYRGLQVLNPTFQYGSTGTMDFWISPGQAPGRYEFTAENDDFFSPAKRSALLTVVNSPGTGLVAGSVAKTVAFNATPAGVLEFYHDADGQLAFSRTIAGYTTYQLGAVPAGSYRLRFVPKNPGIDLDAPWYPNTTSFGAAQPVVVTADAITPDLHFFVFSIPPVTAEVVLPKILSATRVGNAFSLSFKTEAGLQYAIESSSSLAVGSWSQLETFAGDGGISVFVDPVATAAKRFYRIKVTGR